MAIHKKTLTEEEAKKFSEENKLNAEELEAVNGGYLHWHGNGFGYEIINDKTGQQEGGYFFWNDLEIAQRMAKEAGQSTKVLTDKELADLRGNYATGGAKKSHDLS